MKNEDRKFLAKLAVAIIVLVAALASVGLFYLRF